MPVMRRVAAIGGAAGNVDDASDAPLPLAEVANGEAAKIGSGLQVDGHRPLPRGVPLVVVDTIADALVNPRIVHEHVDMAAESAERRVPNPPRRLGVGEVARDQLVTSARRMARDIVAGRFEKLVRSRTNAAARSGDQDV